MPPTVLVLTLVLPLPMEHDYDNHSPDVFRVKVDLAAERPTPLETAAISCVQNEVVVLHLQHKQKPYDTTAYETFASQIKQVIEDLADMEEESEAESEEDDFEDEPATKKAKKGSSVATASSGLRETPTVRKLDAELLKLSIARHEDGKYRKVKPLVLGPGERSLVLFWEPANEDRE